MLEQRKCIFAYASIEVSFNDFTNTIVNKTNQPQMQIADTLSLCAGADAIEILCADAEIFLQHETRYLWERFVVDKNNAKMPT